mmetsp:Transcript_4119/g.8835  ORF Transcript_4119/g.8835 Transcript_4119/m.8835 type:complete len:342 (-) Transcript_4119:1595-2620(-)
MAESMGLALQGNGASSKPTMEDINASVEKNGKRTDDTMTTDDGLSSTIDDSTMADTLNQSGSEQSHDCTEASSSFLSSQSSSSPTSSKGSHRQEEEQGTSSAPGDPTCNGSPTRKRRPGTATSRLATTQELAKEVRQRQGWHTTMERAATRTHHAWRCETGWKDYQEKDYVCPPAECFYLEEHLGEDKLKVDIIRAISQDCRKDGDYDDQPKKPIRSSHKVKNPNCREQQHVFTPFEPFPADLGQILDNNAIGKDDLTWASVSIDTVMAALDKESNTNNSISRSSGNLSITKNENPHRYRRDDASLDTMPSKGCLLFPRFGDYSRAKKRKQRRRTHLLKRV